VEFRRRLLVLAAAAFFIRVLFLLLEPATRPVADERTWTNWAVEAIVTPRVQFNPFRFHMIFHPPLYPFFIAALYSLLGTLVAVKWAQALLGALLVAALGLAGARAFGERVGLAVAALAAVYPELVWFSAHFWSETLFLAFLWWAWERLLAADEPAARAGLAALAGLLWGLAILTRETALYLTPVAGLWLAWGRGPVGRRKGLAFLSAALLTVLPWTYRNWVVFRAFIPVSTAGGLNLYQGNAIEDGRLLGRQEVYDRYEAVQGRVEQYRWARAEGLRSIRERQPAWLFEKLRDEMPNFWEADSQALVHIKRGAYGWPVRPWLALAAALVVLLPFLAILVGFVFGCAAFTWERRRGLLLVFLAYYNLIHVATHGYARYRLPALPVVMMLAAGAFVAWRSGTYPRLGLERRVVAAALALVLGLSLVPSLRRNLADPAFGLQPGAPAEDTESQ
jgi:4-amino-4-deoxy-L-arabinose transferase-like glycosyltransferase